ncbi:MAG: hypothetical protein N838_15920 [Thiohalocapsa sp. PB-PSB1]|nr:MAG: hypothetical protein N838_15920 [Thiohalocapsa sp. PB-PSB1]HCS91908.1 hypothetical protein [Chromatiaceae bacterium]
MLVERQQAENFPVIAAVAKRVGVVLFSGDEEGPRSDHEAIVTRKPKGRRLTVATSGRRFGTNIVSAVAGKGTFQFMLHAGRMTVVVV